MNKRSLILLLFLMTTKLWAQADVSDPMVVVVNIQNPTVVMSRSEVIDIFMGKYLAFPNGDKAIAIDLDSEQESKKRFYQQLVGRSLASINAYWSRIRFSGRMRASLQHTNEQEVIALLEKNLFAIGYLPKSMVNDKLKVVYQLNE